MVGDNQKTGVGLGGHFVQQVTKPGNIGIVQRGIDLVKHADRAGVGKENRKDQRHRGQGLLAARKQREGRELFAGGLAHDLQPGIQRVVALHQYQVGGAAAKQVAKQHGEVFVNGFKSLQKPFAALGIEVGNAVAQLGDSRFEVSLFST